VRRVGRNEWRVLLVTSRYTGEWIVPKGNVEADESAAQTALREAEEEAGVSGELGTFVGTFLQPRRVELAEIDLFLLYVQRVLDPWLEKGQRRRRWFSFDEAREITTRPEVRRMLDLGAELLGKQV
jgi:8-oxo-dGTP pyrophosphatase MutT (NUDIX family)